VRYSMEVPTDLPGEPARIVLKGVLAFFAGSDNEAVGTLGASLQLLQGRDLVFRQDLVNGRHYGDAAAMDFVSIEPGDGTSLLTYDGIQIGGVCYRLDCLTIDLPPRLKPTSLLFKDLGSPASFLLMEVAIESRPVAGCPFKENASGVPLSELGAVIRLADRPRFERAIQQLE